MPVLARFPQRALAVEFLLQPPQGLLHRLTFFQSYFRHVCLTPLSNTVCFFRESLRIIPIAPARCQNLPYMPTVASRRSGWPK